MSVPNYVPLSASNHRIAIIGDFPSTDDIKNNKPFTGAAGWRLNQLCSLAGINFNSCLLANVCQSGKILNWHTEDVQDSLYELKKQIEAFRPNIVLLCGNYALKAAKDCTAPLIQTKKGHKFAYSAGKYRGTLFVCNDVSSPFYNCKCLVTHHPKEAFADFQLNFLITFDLKKAAREGTSPLLKLPDRKFYVTLPIQEQCERLQNLRREKLTVAIDIEGGIDTMSCISFADSPSNAFIVPVYDKSGTVLITPEVWRELALTLEDPNVPKILQNSLYDRFVLHYSYGIRVQGVLHDTMLKHWELYSELEKSLGVQASIYTDEPYYKGDRKSQDDKTFYEYCCRDSAITIEISDKLDNMVTGLPLAHYERNVALLNPVLYMELRGIRYDEQGAKARRAEILNQLHVAQAKLNALTGHGFKCQSTKEFHEATNIFYTKKGDRPRKEYLGAVLRYGELLRSPSPSLATLGELEDLAEVSLNVGSQKQFQHYLYEVLKLPVQMSDVRGQESHPTADYEALLKLCRWCTENKHTHGFAVCQAAIEIRSLQTRQQMLSISADRDGRIRCGYNIVGSNTGRITCYESPTGSGYNLQTIPNYTNIKDAPGGVLGDRDLFLADSGYYFFQCDLSGADGWTVAAYSAMLGDDTMLLDYKAGISPFKILTLMLRGLPVSPDRAELAQQVKVIGKDDWDRFACKRVQHGGSYLEGGKTISRNILKDSEGKLHMSIAECDKLKDFFFQRYWGVRKWHDWLARRLKESTRFQMASGHVRQFFGRPEEILPQLVAAEPQHNTTYATNLAMWRLWSDPENRTRTYNVNASNGNVSSIPSICRLKIEPLHQVHDALNGQFKISDTEWASRKIKSYFDNEIIIAGQKITIPYEGSYGLSWGGKDAGKL